MKHPVHPSPSFSAWWGRRRPESGRAGSRPRAPAPWPRSPPGHAPGSSATTGIAARIPCIASTPGRATARIKSGCRLVNSAARGASARPSPNRTSSTILRPSAYPAGLSAWRKPSKFSLKTLLSAPGYSTPIRAVFSGCCASAASGAARRPRARVPRNARRSTIRSSDPPAAGATAGLSGRGPWRS